MIKIYKRKSCYKDVLEFIKIKDDRYWNTVEEKHPWIDFIVGGHTLDKYEKTDLSEEEVKFIMSL